MKRIPFTTFIIFLCFQTGFSQKNISPDSDKLAWWRDARFGLFIHWGPITLTGAEISWCMRTDLPWCKPYYVPREVYEQLYKQFNPVNFDARKWVQYAKDAGMKYIVFVSKHHDGFVMWDSKLTDYKITNTPFGRDVLRELSDAAKEANMPFGIYFSPGDWHDLVRSGLITSVIPAWISKDDARGQMHPFQKEFIIYAIPQAEMDVKPGLYQQNAGYQ